MGVAGVAGVVGWVGWGLRLGVWRLGVQGLPVIWMFSRSLAPAQWPRLGSGWFLGKGAYTDNSLPLGRPFPVFSKQFRP